MAASGVAGDTAGESRIVSNRAAARPGLEAAHGKGVEAAPVRPPPPGAVQAVAGHAAEVRAVGNGPFMDESGQRV